jgi:hypothetical protein
MNIDPAKARRESLRWYILLALNTSRPVYPRETVVLSTIQSIFSDTALELRRELDYLNDRSLANLDSGECICGLTHYGVDTAEYTIPCDRVIDRPEKYWS